MHLDKNKLSLGVNIDHIATLREARKINDPDPLVAIAICAHNGADQITIHLREDRRHIHDSDVEKIISSSNLPVNLEASIDESIIDIACHLKPHRVTLVPEKRDEVTTEGGLDLKNHYEKIKIAVDRLKSADIEISLFIDPNKKSIELAEELNVEWVELHTGLYSNIFAMLYGSLSQSHNSIKELELPRKELISKLDDTYANIVESANLARSFGLKVAAGHGLNYQNVKPIVNIETIEELNIGHSIIARSVFSGLADAVRDMKVLCKR